MPRKAPRPEPYELIARIETVEQSYYISEHADHRPPVGDEAIIDIVGKIERISPKLNQHLDRQIEISLVCAQSYEGDARTPASDKPFLLSVKGRLLPDGLSPG